MRICDDGEGLAADHRQGFGMIGMRERVLALGGSMSVSSTNPGVEVEALIPNARPPLRPPGQSTDPGLFPGSAT